MTVAAFPDHDDIVVLRHVSWDNFQHLLRMRGDHSAPRVSYLDGEVEIMSPSQDHEFIKSTIGRLMESWCIDRDMEIRPVGSWTLERKESLCAAEPDECYIFGREKRNVPHLAIEVEWTQRGIDKLAIYEKLGVEEVWFWRKGVIEIYILTDGEFVTAQHSRLLTNLDLELLASVLDRETLTDAVRDFRKALQNAQ